MSELGARCINPARNFGGRTDLDWHIYIGKAMKQVLEECTAIYFMKGWEDSKGARIEYLIAKARGIPIYFEVDPDVQHLMELDGIVEEAYSLVHGDRNKSYGSPVHDFSRQHHIAYAMGVEIMTLEVPKFMMAVKLSRQVNKPKRDNLVDLAGYVLCFEWVKKDLQKGKL